MNFEDNTVKLAVATIEIQADLIKKLKARVEELEALVKSAFVEAYCMDDIESCEPDALYDWVRSESYKDLKDDE